MKTFKDSQGPLEKIQVSQISCSEKFNTVVGASPVSQPLPLVFVFVSVSIQISSALNTSAVKGSAQQDKIELAM
jgi:hypothetical protein